MMMKSVINSYSSLFILMLWSLLLSHFVVVFSLNSEGEALLSLLNNNFFFEDSDSVKLDWNNLSSSNISSSPCDWLGVGCNTQNTHIVSLNLSGYYIPGQLGPQIGQLTYLKYLDLTDNRFNGSMPIELRNCSHLKYLDLSWNNFNGSIPIELWNCSHLQYLDLSMNKFIGELPEAMKNLNQLNFLSIFGNHLSGRIPVSLFQISGLKYVDLSSNNLTKIPTTELLWNCSHLQHLDLSLNHFTGEFPHESMRNLHQLKTFSIYSNQFIGRIPDYLFRNSGLEDVDLRDNNLTGSIPVNIGNATNMKNLKLSANQLHGTIPTSISNCTKLEFLDLSNNGGLSGEIPLGVWRIPTLFSIDVRKSNLSGELPVEMTELHHLKSIYLSDNHFSGLIPEALGINSTGLAVVDLSNNSFSGEIPPNLCFGKQLTEMRLNQNQFHGSIPSSYFTGNCHSLLKLTLQGNKLTGSLPHFGQVPLNNTNSLAILDLSRNNIQGQIPSSICNMMPSLSSLVLSENQMNGTLPHCLDQLSIVNLRSNNFSGTVPNFSSQTLYLLDLNGNRLEGKIPRSLGIGNFLSFLDLGNNQFNDTFPSFLENSSSLEILVLRSNKLYGSLEQHHPHSRYLAFSTLKILDISSNYFSGNLPLGLFILGGLDAMKNIDKNTEESSSSSRIYYLPISTLVIHKGKETELNQTMMNTFGLVDMSNNRFQGSIPEWIGKLLVLTSLNLSNNNLNGLIPSSLGNLTQLESLDLSKNKLYGEIPRQLTNLNFLGVLNLSNNNLTGLIPIAGQFLTYPNSSFDGNPGLCGLQSSTGCGGSPHRDSVVEKESHEDSNSWNFGWEPVVIGYGCGVLIALVLQYFIFTKASMYRWFG